MDKCELAKLGYDTDNLTSEIDYVPDLNVVDDEVEGDFVERAQLQATELNAMGGVNILGGPLEHLDEINVALDDGVDLITAVEQFGDEGQKKRARQLINTGQIIK